MKSNIRIVNMRSTLFVVFLLCIVAATSAQQEAMYSQYMFNMLNVNPAYAGNRAVNNVTALHRSQWVGFEGSPMTTTISWDARKNQTNVGYGLQLYNDQLGIEKTTGFQGFYSYRLPFENSSLAFGLSLGVLNFSAEYTKVSTINPGDPAFAENENSWLPSAGFGMLYSAENWYVGLSIPALLKTKKYYSAEYAKNQTVGANNHYFLNGGYIFDVSQSLKLKPSVLFKYVLGAPLQVDLNMNAWINNMIGFGVSYRTNDAIVGMAELQITPKLRVGYAYDYTITQLNNYNYGSHEIMLRYEFDLSKEKVLKTLSPRYY